MAYSFTGSHLEYPTGTGTSSTNPVTTSFQAPSGTKALVLMLIWAPAGARDNTNNTPTFGGYSFTQINTRRQAGLSPEGSAEMWVLINPPTDQSYTLSVPNGNAMAVKVWASFVGADGNIEIGATGGNGGTSTNPAYTLSGTGTDTLVFGVIFSGANTWAPTGRSGAQIYDRDLGTWGGGCQYRISGTGGTTQISWLFGTSDDWGIVAGELLETAAGVTGNANLTQSAQTLNASGEVSVSASGALTQGGQTLTASAGVLVIGSAALNQAGQALDASGTTQPIISGDANLAQAPQAVTASGAVGIAGALTQTQGAQSVTAGGAVSIGGALTKTQGADAVSGSGAVRVTGNASMTQAGQGLSASAGVRVSGSAGLVQAGQGLSASGAVIVTGNAGVVQGADTLTASASSEGVISGNAALVQAGQALSASAQVALTAGAGVAQASNALSGVGQVAIAGNITAYQDAHNLIGYGGALIAGSMVVVGDAHALIGSGIVLIQGAVDYVQGLDTLNAMILTRAIYNPAGVEIGNGKTGQAGILGVRGHEERVTLGASVEVEGHDGAVSVGR